MSTDDILQLIDEGILDYYLNQNYEIGESDTDQEIADCNDTVEVRHSNLAKKIMFQARTAMNKENILKVEAIAKGKMLDLHRKDPTKVQTMFVAYIRDHGLAVNYRNFQEMTEDEMASIMEQITFTELIESIQSEFDNDK
jgi:hypothetical protein